MKKPPKSRKTHLFLASIQTAWSAKSTDPKYKSTPYWTLFVQVENVLDSRLEKVYNPTQIKCPIFLKPHASKK